MPQIVETHKNNFTISTDPTRLDLDSIANLLARAYWAKRRTREAIARSIQHSLVFGLYDGKRQIGLARVVSDYTTFAWLCDVFIHEDYRGQGLGKWLIETVMSHPDLQGLRRWSLITRDAHGLYRQFGWKSLSQPDTWMEIFNG
ncbi:MAG TPA: GNAT family N-acetyltransferase [Anaerolineales bacterium]|nr:GNAT family N-acetyltransferase [Anaerolineales bacterium]